MPPDTQGAICRWQDVGQCLHHLSWETPEIFLRVKLSLLKERVLCHVSSHQLSETLHQPRSVVLWHYCHYLHVSFSCRLTACAGSGGLHVGRGSVSAVFIQFPRGVSPPEPGQSAPLTCLELLSSPILVYR